MTGPLPFYPAANQDANQGINAMFDLRIRCKTIDDAERILSVLKNAADPAVVKSVGDQSHDGPEEQPQPTKVPKPRKPKANTLAAVKAALLGVQTKYGAGDMTRPLAILAKFGAGRVTGVKRADYVGFIAACAAA